MFRPRGVAVLVAAAILALAGCSAVGSTSGDGEGGGTLTWGSLVPATTFAQKDMGWGPEWVYSQAVYDSLLRLSPDGEIEPGLATEWEYDDSGKTLTLTLRDDVTFTSGDALTAQDAAASLMAYKSGTSPTASTLQNVSDAVAVDDDTLELSLSAPDPSLLTVLSQAAGMVAPAAHVDDEAMATDPIGSGPFVLNNDETVVGSTYVFDKNEAYWNPEDQHYDKLVIQVYSDVTAQLNAIQGGQVNVSTTLDATLAPQIEAAGYTLNESEVDWTGLLISDRAGTISPPMADVRVRQAINFAIDRESVLETVGGGYGTVTTQIFPTYSTSYDPALDDYYDFDLEKAKALMAEAGYADGFELTMPTLQGSPPGPDALFADQLAQIGITVRYEPLAISDYISDLLAAKYAVTGFQLGLDETDYQTATLQIGESAPWNVFHVSTPEVEQLIATIQNGDDAEAEAAGAELNKYIVENAWFVPYYRVRSIFVSDQDTSVELQRGTPVVSLWNVQPK